jgi:hypothetical protein
MAKIPLNVINRLSNDIQVSPKFKKVSKTQVRKRVLAARSEMLDLFDSHAVTQELLMGPSGSNISGTLGGIGNLFAYIGFESGDKPITRLRAILASYSINFTFAKGRSVVNIDVPTAQEAFSVTPMPWAIGRSWAKGIETGIAGFGQFLSGSYQASRSGEGLQSGSRVRGGGFKNRPYISLLIKEYNEKIKRLEKESNR